MKFQKTLLATALGVAATGANATNLGEFWATDQMGGTLHIFNQADLNDPTVDAQESKVDLVAAGGVHNSVRNHIIGFSNNSGLDPESRAILTYLGGWMEIWNTNGGTGAPTQAAEVEVSTANTYTEQGLGAPQKGNTIHACGGNPQNTQIQCASIFNADFTLFDADMATNTYTRIGTYKTGNLTVSPKLKGKMKKTVQTAYDELVANDGDANPNNICSQYSSDGSLLYLAVQNNSVDGGVIVMDVSDPYNPTILDAYNDVMAAGCGLVNNPDGEHLWITHGFNKQGDPEEVSVWSYSQALAGKKSGPVDRIALPTDDSQDTYGGDAHGAQYAGLLSSFMWQVMRVDDTVQVITNDGGSGKLVNELDLEEPGRANVQPDVIDRSAFGTRMYWTTRGARPSSAISTYNFADRSGQQGVDVWATIFGYSGVHTKTEIMTSGNTMFLCPDNGDKADGGNDDDGYVDICAQGDTGAVEVDQSDPHGGKSLNYISGF